MLGEEDPEVSAAEARGWESCTAGPARVVVLPGDHFYLDADRDAALAHIGRALAALG